MRKILSFLCVFLLMISCSKKQDNFSNALDAALHSKDSTLRKVLGNMDKYEVQITYSEIQRINGGIVFKDTTVGKPNYFYPASTVKFPVAVLALEKLNTLDSINRNTKFYIEGDTIETTFAKEITKIFAVSDNDAFNRLVEFLGQDYINEKLSDKGIKDVRISHRLSTDNAYEITTKPLVIYKNDSSTVVSKTIINTSAKPLELIGIKKGIGYMDEDSIVHQPFNFSLKNNYPIAAQHNVLKRIFFPEAFAEQERFHLSKNQLTFLKNAMKSYPKEAGYNATDYYDSYGKFFMYGDSKEPIPSHIKIYNKVGYAYGTITDCAYIVDTKNNIEFLITATLLVNKNKVFNDNTYEYDTVGIPFLASLGKKIYEYHLKN